MSARALLKIFLAASAFVVLVVLAISSLGTDESPRTGENLETGQSGGVPRQTAEDARADEAPHRVQLTVPSKHVSVEGTVRDTVGTPLAGVRITGRLLEGPRATKVPSPPPDTIRL